MKISMLWVVVIFMLGLFSVTASAADKGKIYAMILIGDGRAATSNEMMKDFFEGNTLGGYSIESVKTYAYNTSFGVTESGIDACIEEAFKGATRKDICFFYYGGHGRVNKNTKKGVGITLTDTTWYDYDTLAQKLIGFKGKIYVILDCCYAGEFINAVKRLPAYKKAKDRVIVMTASGDRTTGLKFFKSGWDILKLGESYQRFTYMISKGVGTKGGDSLKADKNKDGAVTLRELYDYVNNIINTSNPQYYGDDNTILYRADISLNKTNAIVYMSENRTLQLKATVSVPKVKVAWSSNDKSVAVVDSKGKVTVKKSGIVTITAKAKGVTAKCKITVKQARTQIKLNKNRVELSIPDTKTVQLRATVTGTNQRIAWSSSNKNVAVVSSTGKVTAKSAGTAAITAKINGKTAKCTVTVKDISKTYYRKMYAEYRKVVMNNIDDYGQYGQFAFYDADYDSIPELYVWEKGYVCNVYNFVNNRLKKIGSLKEGIWLYTNPGKTGIVNTSADNIGVYKITKTRVVKTAYYECTYGKENGWLAATKKYMNAKYTIPSTHEIGIIETAYECSRAFEKLIRPFM